MGKLQQTLGSEGGLHKALSEKDGELQEIQRNMKNWKEQTAGKLAQKFKEEMDRELDKLELICYNI